MILILYFERNSTLKFNYRVRKVTKKIFSILFNFRFQAKLGVGGNEFDDRPRLTSIVSTAMDSDRVCAVGRIMLAILEQQAMERAEQLLVANKSDLDFSNGHLSPALSTVRYFDGSSVTSLEFARIRSSTEYLVTIHEVCM